MKVVDITPEEMQTNGFGYNPFDKKTYVLDTWLNTNDKNIVVCIDEFAVKYPIVCLNKQHLKRSSCKSIYKLCKYDAHLNLQVDETLGITKQLTRKHRTLPSEEASPNYVEVGDLFGMYLLVKYIHMQNMISPDANRCFRLVKDKQKQQTFINTELLKESDIQNFKGDSHIDTSNIPYREQVYFNSKIAKALKAYTHRWDFVINALLRHGGVLKPTNTFFKSREFKDTVWKYGDPEISENLDEIHDLLSLYVHFGDNTKKFDLLNKLSFPFNKPREWWTTDWTPEDQKYLNECLEIQQKKLLQEANRKENIDLAINTTLSNIQAIDECFLTFAPRVTSKISETKYYRGMTKPYKFARVGDKCRIPNYSSISKDKDVAKKFGILKEQTISSEHPKLCCLYEITLAEGIPYIDMVNTTKYKSEHEMLLPRNLIATLIKVTTESLRLDKKVEDSTSQQGFKVVKQPFDYDLYHIRFELDVKSPYQKNNTHVCIPFEVGQFIPCQLKDILKSRSSATSSIFKKIRMFKMRQKLIKGRKKSQKNNSYNYGKHTRMIEKVISRRQKRRSRKS